MMRAKTAEPTEKIIAPRARPEPVLMLHNQKIFAITYPKSAPTHKSQLPFNEYSFERISAMISKVIKSVIGITQNILFFIFSHTR